jgi:hypothetical protein
MPDAVSFRVTTYRKLAKDETGMTQMGSVRVDAAAALMWILDELPDDAWDVTHEDPDKQWHAVTLRIDWAKVPDSIRDPKLPARRR